MTNPITPEVRASMDIVGRSRKWANDNRRCPWESPDFDGCGIARSVYWAHLETVANAMLSLFPPGMPEPVEMFQCDKGIESTSPFGRYEAFSDRQAAVDFQRVTDMGKPYRGLFVPLERVEA